MNRRYGTAAGSPAAMVALLAILGAVRAGADPMPPRASRVDPPGLNTASEDSAESLVLNPANLGYLPAPEFRWTGEFCGGEATTKVNCGHAFDLATPLPLNLATGLRLDYVTPGAAATFGPTDTAPYAASDYAWVTWGIAYKFSSAFSVGASVQHSYSTNSFLDGLWGISAGVSLRPNTHLALAFVAHDLNGPSIHPLVQGGLPVLDRSYVLSAALRPLGKRSFEIGLDLQCIQGTDLRCFSTSASPEAAGQPLEPWLRDQTGLLPRATLGVDVPGVGRLRGDVQVSHIGNDQLRGVLATAGLDVSFGKLMVGGGALFGNGLGSSSSVGGYATASIAGYSTPGLPKLARAVFLRIEHTPDVRTHTALLRQLWQIANNPKIVAVTLVLRAEPADSLAHAEEVADAIRLLRVRKKKVLCSWESAGSRALYVCANADRTVVNPAGALRYAGLRAQYIYLGGLLKKLGVHAEFVRISDHKSAPEQFTNEHASEIARADHEDLLRENEAVFTKDVALGRHMSEERVREVTRNGPFIASEAKDAGFIDGTAFDDEIERVTRELVGSNVSFDQYAEETTMPAQFGPRAKVAIVYVDGDIVDGRSSHIPLVDMNLVGSYSLVDTIRNVREDPSIRSVVLRIESPGGSSMASDVMWRAIEQLAKEKPVIVSMGTVAASGGYYIASPARTIYALPLTVTGSIGIFVGKADVSGLLGKIGVTVDTYKTAPRADEESLFRPSTQEERDNALIKIRQYYNVFLDRVSQGRHMSKEEVDSVGQGRVWSGQEAWQRHLVDKMGGLRQALDEARAAAFLPNDAPVVELPENEASLFDKALKLVGVPGSSVDVTAALPARVKELARAVAPMMVYAADVPLARLEFVPLEQ